MSDMTIYVVLFFIFHQSDWHLSWSTPPYQINYFCSDHPTLTLTIAYLDNVHFFMHYSKMLFECVMFIFYIWTFLLGCAKYFYRPFSILLTVLYYELNANLRFTLPCTNLIFLSLKLHIICILNELVWTGTLAVLKLLVTACKQAWFESRPHQPTWPTAETELINDLLYL